jgi:hypothetical protein
MIVFAWPANETGPCGSCRQPTRRYGPQGSTFCSSCDPQAVMKEAAALDADFRAASPVRRGILVNSAGFLRNPNS